VKAAFAVGIADRSLTLCVAASAAGCIRPLAFIIAAALIPAWSSTASALAVAPAARSVRSRRRLAEFAATKHEQSGNNEREFDGGSAMRSHFGPRGFVRRASSI
jgi:hypothetical protein